MTVRAILIRALFLLCAIQAHPAAAHSPYFSDPLDCPAPEGVEFRFLYGDGLFGPDPMALTVLDAAGHLLAFQDVGLTSFLVPDEDCLLADPSHGVALRYVQGDDDTQRGQVLGDGEDARANRWAYEPGIGQEGFGFQSIPLSDIPLTSRIAGELTHSWRQALVLASLAFLSLAAIWGPVTFSGRLRLRWRILVIAAGVLVSLQVAFMGFVSAVLWPLSASMLTVSMILAVAGVLAVRWLLRARRQMVR